MRAQVGGGARTSARSALGGTAAVLLVTLAACSEPERVDAWSLHNGFRRASGIELVARDAALFPRAELLAARLATTEPSGSDVPDSTGAAGITVLGPGETGDASAVRIVLGALADPEVLALARPLGIEPTGTGFRLLGRDHDAPADGLVAVFADPERSGLPLILCAGNDPGRFALRLETLPAPWLPSLVTFRAGGLGLELRLAAHGTPLVETLIDRAEERARLRASAEVLDRDGLRVFRAGALDGGRLDSYLAAAERARARVRAWLGPDSGGALPGHTRELHAHVDVAGFERATGSHGLACVDPATLRIDVLLAPGLADDGGAAAARAEAWALAGSPAEPWLAGGAAVAAAGSYWGRPLEEWSALLAAAELVPAALELARPGAERRHSPHVLVPTRGLAVARAVERKGAVALRAAWRGETTLEVEAVGAARGTALSPAVLREREERRAAALATRLRGVALYGDAGRTDYAAPTTEDSLRAVRGLGGDAFSVTVQASVAPRDAALLADRAVDGSAGDAALAYALAAGRGLDLRSVLVVEPMLAPFGTWADGGLFAEESTVREVFEVVERVSLHYTLLAELCRADVVCLGSGLRPAGRTLARDFDGAWLAATKENRRVFWSELFRRARAAFGGALTYAAVFPKESGQVSFWDQLDLIGLSGLPPIAPHESDVDDAPTNNRLTNRIRTRLSDAAELGERMGKPVLFLQIGFPARRDAWRDPRLPLGPTDPLAQERYYAVLASVLSTRPAEEAPIGLLLWSWNPAYPRDAPSQASGGFSPRGQPAEQHLAEVFGRR